MFIDSEYKLVLGSKSPRRKELISMISPNIEIRTPEVDEIYDPEMNVYLVPEYLAKLKVIALTSSLKRNEIIVCADTIVILEKQILEKPSDLTSAGEMLRRLSGKKHEVITGCCLKSIDKEILFSCKTDVYFNHLSSEAIEYYVNQYRPLDKAGSYGIQEWIGIVGIRKINGCYYNVMGLPVSALIEQLEEFN